jgi:DNA-directed RNA polymerase specialized sigma24 family protein
LTFDEIAQTLELSLNTVASRYRYALQKLKDWVPEELESPSKEREVR